MKKTVDNITYYAIPNSPYYISIGRDVYNNKRHKLMAKEGNTVTLSIDGSRRRCNCDKLLVEALIAHIEEQEAEHSDARHKLGCITEILLFGDTLDD
jgi:hypothetical protein